MSIATAKQFLQKVQNDQALRAKLLALSDGGERTLAEVVRIAGADGFVFTAGEFEPALKEHLAQHAARPLAAEQPARVLARSAATELSEEDLGLVAGGKKHEDELTTAKESTEGSLWGKILGGILGL